MAYSRPGRENHITARTGSDAELERLFATEGLTTERLYRGRSGTSELDLVFVGGPSSSCSWISRRRGTRPEPIAELAGAGMLTGWTRAAAAHSAVIALAVGLASCAGADGAAEGAASPADGDLVAYDLGDVQLSYPASWTVQTGEDMGVQDADVEFLGPGEPGNRLQIIVAVVELPDQAPVEAYVQQNRLLRQAQLQDLEIVTDEPTTVEGSSQATLLASRYTAIRSATQEEVPVTQSDLWAQVTENSYLHIRSVGPTDTFDQTIVDRVYDSVRVGGSPA